MGKHDNMTISDKNNKENFRLLDLSSEELSEDLELNIIPSRKKRVTRRDRSRGIPAKTTEVSLESELQCAVRWAVRGTLLLWLLMLTWLCAALYDQVSTIRLDITKVSTSSDSVGDALQVCHTAAKELRANASELSIRLNKLELEHVELVKKMEGIKEELSSISTQLGAAPMLGEMPRRLNELQRTLADVGSQIRGFDGNLNSVRKQAVAAVTSAEQIRTILTQLEARTNETIANLTRSVKVESDMEERVGVWNATFMKRVDELQHKLEEITKLSQTTVAPTAAPTPSSTVSSTTSTTTTTTLPPPPLPPTTFQAPPAKPSILSGVQ